MESLKQQRQQNKLPIYLFINLVSIGITMIGIVTVLAFILNNTRVFNSLAIIMLAFAVIIGMVGFVVGQQANREGKKTAEATIAKMDQVNQEIEEMTKDGKERWDTTTKRLREIGISIDPEISDGA
jgi:uncharacterized membrane protein